MKCVILTIAYNAEQTIARTIESVLTQSYENWSYYIVDNGSTDATYEICQRYAGQHDQLTVWKEEKNDIWAVIKYLRRLLAERQDMEGLAFVDADDVCTPEFLDAAVTALETYHADLAILGTQSVNAANGAFGAARIVPQDLVVSRKNLNDVFLEIHWFLRQLWCKLYRVSVLRRYELCAYSDLVYGGDTAMVLQFLEHADKFVLVSTCGYYYYMSPKSSSYRFVSGRYQSDQFLFQKTIDFLDQKTDNVSEKNRAFMRLVYYYSLVDTIRVVCNSDAAPQQKLMELYHSYCNPITEELLQKGSVFLQEVDLCQQLHVPTVNCVVSLADVYTTQECKMVFDIFLQMNPQFGQMISCVHLQWMMICASELVADIALCRYEKAFAVLWDKLKAGELDCREVTLLLGQSLSGILALEQEYAMFSKLLIEWCIKNGQRDRADKELSDWLLMRPDDPELLELKEQL